MLSTIRWSNNGKLGDENSENAMNTLNHEREWKSNRPVQLNWNNSEIKEEQEVQSHISDSKDPQDTRIYEPSRSTQAESTPGVPNEVPRYDTQISLSRQTEAELPPSNREPVSSRLSQPEEAYVLPQPSDISAPRMLQPTVSGQSGSQNAFKRLRTMGTVGEEPEKLPALPPPGDLGSYAYPTAKPTGKKTERKRQDNKPYRATRCACCFATMSTVLLVACAIAAIVYVIIEREQQCLPITVMIILMSLMLVVIVILEWTRGWLWREAIPYNYKKARTRLTGEGSMASVNSGGRLPTISTTPGPMANPTYPVITPQSDPAGGLSVGFQRKLYEVPQFVSGLCLIVLYIISALFICGTLIAAGMKLEKCEQVGLIGITYAAILAMLLCMRIVTCCMSDACQGLCHRAATTNSPTPVPMVAVNPLHQVLPTMGGHWHVGGETTGGSRQPMAWLINLANASDSRHQLSIIRPIPAQYASV